MIFYADFLIFTYDEQRKTTWMRNNSFLKVFRSKWKILLDQVVLYMSINNLCPI